MAAPPLSLRGVYDSLRVPTLRDLVFSTKAYLATALALIVGFSQNLENPYWAVLTIYIVLNPPETGAIRSKALFRFIGTIAGGTLMMGVTGLLGDQLGILVTVTLGIIVGATFLRQIDRTPANYLWFSAGVTAGVVGLTNLMAPTNVFDYATARMGEISLGILAITAVDSAFWPRPMTPDFLKTMAGWRAQTSDWLVDALSLTAAQSPDEDRRRALRQGLRELTKAVGVIDAKAVQLPFDVVAMAPRGRQLNLLRRQVVELIADLAGIEIWARSLRHDRRLHTDLGRSLDQVTRWVQETPDDPHDHAANGTLLIHALEETRDALDPAGGEILTMERGLLSRLAAFVRAWSVLGIALHAIETGTKLPAPLERMARQAKPVRSADYLGAFFDVVPMILSTGLTTLIWYFTAWSSGGGALLFSFIGCVFLTGQDRILSSSVGLVTWVMTAFAMVFLYQYAILPRVTDFPVLIAVLGCVLLPFGLMMAMNLAGMLICVYIFAFLGLQSAYAADFNQSLQTLNASLAGLLIACGCLYVCSYDHARFAARRLVLAVRRDILDIARSRRMPDRERFLFLVIDRLALYFPAAEQIYGPGQLPRLRMIDDFGIGINLLALRQCEADVTPHMHATLCDLRAQTARSYRDRLAGRADDGTLRAMVNEALADPALTAETAHGRLREALMGMHLALEDEIAPPPGEIIP